MSSTAFGCRDNYYTWLHCGLIEILGFLWVKFLQWFGQVPASSEARLQLGLNRNQFKNYCRLCASMCNAHRPSAVDQGPAKPGNSREKPKNSAKLFFRHISWVIWPLHGLEGQFCMCAAHCPEPIGSFLEPSEGLILTTTSLWFVANNCCFEIRSEIQTFASMKENQHHPSSQSTTMHSLSWWSVLNDQCRFFNSRKMMGSSALPALLWMWEEGQHVVYSEFY